MKYLKIILLLSTLLIAKQHYNSVFIDEVTSVYDGDTFKVNINSYPDIIGKRVPIRLSGIDTPELRSKCQKEKQLARIAKQLTVNILRGAKVIELKNLKRGKYFRIIADVYADDKNLASELIKNNLAVIYNGGTKIKNWCK
ncbi:thermonuclease family protein [Sulfurospirillum sp.]|nr:thermonuclease family protein [Sulfurospirillum sp.]